MEDNINNNSLIPFDMLIDTEMGLMKLIEFKYNKGIFNYKALGKDDLTKLYLMQRDNWNPLSIICDETVSQDDKDDLYYQFMNKEYEQIMLYSPNTTLFDMVNLVYRNENIRFTIVCKNEQELDFLKRRHCKAYQMLVCDMFDSQLLLDNTSIYIKYIRSLYLQPKDFKNKSLYIGDYAFNKREINKSIFPNIPIEDFERFDRNSFYYVTLNKINMKRIEFLLGESILPEKESEE